MKKRLDICKRVFYIYVVNKKCMKLNFKTTRQIWEFLQDLGCQVENSLNGFYVNNTYFVEGDLQEMKARIVSLVSRKKI